MPETPSQASAVVFLHGVGGAARAWGPQTQSFPAAGFAAIALDLPGYGARSPTVEMNFEALAEDVETAIAAHHLQRPVLIGHSLGGMVAQTMLRRRPDGYAAAVLCCTSPAFGNPGGDFQKRFVADRLAPLQSGKRMADLAADIIGEIVGPAPDPKGLALAVDCMGAVPAETYRAAVLCLTGFDERANLGSIRVPVLCLAGEHDRNAPPPMMERMAGRVPGARYVCLPGVGHLPNLERPAAFDAAVFEFLRAVEVLLR
ncbi:MAG: alpha/beta hydrolase [Xanthobacteraceae bacterium]|nr:alpha/beta hydrolase [Xanthobacteraceae bacterium]